MIPSEQQAEKIGEARTGGKRGQAFEVFMYEHRPSRVTLFGVELPDGSLITADPSVSATRMTKEEKEKLWQST